MRLVVTGPGVGGDGCGLGVGRGPADHVEIGKHGTEPLELILRRPGVLAGQVTGGIERRDAEELEDQATALRRGLLAEGGQLLLLGEDRRPEGGVIHAQDRVHVAPRVARPLGHLLVVGMGLRLHRRVGATDGAAHEVEVTLVLELHLGHAFPAHAGGAHFVHRRP